MLRIFRRAAALGGYRYFSLAMLARIFRISARARKARTFTSGTDQPVSREISLTGRSSISSKVITRRAAGESCSSTRSINCRAASACSAASAGWFTKRSSQSVFAAEAFQFLKGLEPDFLNDVFDLAFSTGVAAGGGKNARGIFLDQWFEAFGIAFQDRGYQLRFGWFHCPEYAQGLWVKSKATAVPAGRSADRPRFRIGVSEWYSAGGRIANPRHSRLPVCATVAVPRCAPLCKATIPTTRLSIRTAGRWILDSGNWTAPLFLPATTCSSSSNPPCSHLLTCQTCQKERGSSPNPAFTFQKPGPRGNHWVSFLPFTGNSFMGCPGCRRGQSL